MTTKLGRGRAIGGNPVDTPTAPSRPSIRLHGQTFDFYLLLGGGNPTVSGGGATYEEQPRPGRSALTVYTGDALVKLDVPILLEGWRERRDVMPTVEKILSIASGGTKPGTPPPDFKATGPFPYSGMRFQMELPEYGEGWGRSGNGPSGTLHRLAMTLKLVQFEDPDTLDVRKRRYHAAVGDASVAGGNVTVTKGGESLLHVSNRVYGDTTHAKEIGDLNGIRDIRKPLKAGTKLNLPPA
jgi:hypothetical protein